MPNIEIRQMRPEDEQETREITCYEFFQIEPIVRSLGLGGERNGRIWFDVTFPPSLRDGVSTVAVDQDTGKIIGFSLTAIFHKDEQEAKHFSKDDPNTRDLALLYEILTIGYKGVDLFAQYSVDKLANIQALCVVPQLYQRQGTGGKLVAKTIELIREKKTPLVTAEATGRFSRRVFEKLGFEKTAQYNYASMLMEGKPLPMSEELEYHTAIAFCVKVM